MGERGDHGFEVAPTRIGGSGGPGRSARRRRAPIVLVILLAVAVPSIAWAGPRIVWRPEVDLSLLLPTPTPVPTPTPRPTPVPTPPPASPLPAITIGVGPHPTEPFPVDVGGLRLADPATGSLGPPLGLRVDTDAIFTSPGSDGWWCVCFVRVPDADRETATVEIRRVERSGRVTFLRTVGEYRSVAPPPAQDFYNRFDLVVSPDKRTAYLASATRSGDEWSVAVESIDVATGTVSGRSGLGKFVIPPITGPTPPPDQGTMESYLNGPLMRLSPDGRRILIWASIESYTSNGEQQASFPQGWLIDVDPGAAGTSVGGLTPLSHSFVDRLRTCNWAGWTGVNELAAICWPMNALAAQTVTLVLMDPDGTEHAHIELAGLMDSWVTDPVFDRATRFVYLWQPQNHVLSRVDLDGGRSDQLKVDPAATGGGPAGASSGEPPPDWATFSSDMRLYYGPQLLAEPGGSRLFALGVDPEQSSVRFSSASTGIWVFDGRQLSLLDHWEPLAGYASIGLSRDGRWLFAAGTPGADEHGREAQWQSSITVHDVSDGRPALQLGRLGSDAQVFQVPP